MSNDAVTTDMIAELMDSQLSDTNVQKLQRQRQKDSGRFEKYIEVLQSRVPWDEPILLRLTDHLYIVQGAHGARTVRCSCGNDFGDYRVNWKLGSRIRVRRETSQMEEVYSPAYAAPEAGWIEVREYFCPTCATQLAVEAVPPGYPPLFDMFPDLDTFYRDVLGTPLRDEDPSWYTDKTLDVTEAWMKELDNARD